ncbi:MAG: hypothetical protein R3D29_15840 [Nitratireductor sp.]
MNHASGDIRLPFTVMSGAGFGLIALLGPGMAMPEGPLAYLICLLGGGLAVSGLLHLPSIWGHPGARLAGILSVALFPLSREGVLAVATLLAFALYALVWMTTGERIALLGILVAVLSGLTVLPRHDLLPVENRATMASAIDAGCLSWLCASERLSAGWVLCIHHDAVGCKAWPG